MIVNVMAEATKKKNVMDAEKNNSVGVEQIMDVPTRGKDLRTGIQRIAAAIGLVIRTPTPAVPTMNLIGATTAAMITVASKPAAAMTNRMDAGTKTAAAIRIIGIVPIAGLIAAGKIKAKSVDCGNARVTKCVRGSVMKKPSAAVARTKFVRNMPGADPKATNVLMSAFAKTSMSG